jgi:hypothetical protein
MVLDYYGSVCRRAVSRSKDFWISQGLVIGVVLLVLGVLSGLAFIHWYSPPPPKGQHPMSDLIVTAIVSGLSPIVVIGVLVFLFYLVRAPAELAGLAQQQFGALEKTHQSFIEEHASAITKLHLEIGDLGQRLASRKPAFAISIQRWFQLMGPNIGVPCNLIFQVTIRNSGERSALSDWKLEIPSLASEPISPHRGQWQEWVFGMVRDAKTGQRVLTDLVSQTEIGMDRGDIARGTLMFAIPDLSQSLVGKETIKATLTCLDAQGEQHCAQPTTSLEDITC